MLALGIGCLVGLSSSNETLHRALVGLFLLLASIVLLLPELSAA
jgi:hypothetical protein